MAKILGSVTINPSTGNATGSGVVKSVYDALIAAPSSAAIPSGAPGAPAKEQIADVARSLAPSMLDLLRYDLTTIKTSAYSAQFFEVVLCNPGSGGFTVTLPAITADDVGKWLIVKKVSASTNAVTYDGNGSDTIQGSATRLLTLAWGAEVLVAQTTTTWFTLGPF